MKPDKKALLTNLIAEIVSGALVEIADEQDDVWAEIEKLKTRVRKAEDKIEPNEAGKALLKHLGLEPIEEKPKHPRAFAPHCDSQILHSPGYCTYCDNYPDWQDYRVVAGIAFTDDLNADGVLAPCPSTAHRSAATRDLWPGNRPEGYTRAKLSY